MSDPDQLRLQRYALMQAEQQRLYHHLRTSLDRVAGQTGLTLDLLVWADCGQMPAGHETLRSNIEIGGEQVQVELVYLVRDAATSVIVAKPLALFAAARIGEQQPSA